ncbi:MAG: YcjX family protein, partial [Paracoccus sp. (in: a-proteobacteria)]|nr:YcjX family protein [Paracoccus sp. (in: a-proteobacteria)]
MGLGSNLLAGIGLGDKVIRLGVTGLSRAGKTVFITSLVANLMDRGRMGALRAASDGSLRAAWLQPQPDDTVPRFDYERHLSALTGPAPYWPEGTRHVSQLRLSLRLGGRGLLSGLTGGGERVVHLDIVDYPGEWLLDLRLMDRDFKSWSAEVLERMEGRPLAEEYRAALAALDLDAPFDEQRAQSLADLYTRHLHAAREAGWSDCTPGRFLIPGEMAGSPAL